MTPRDTSKHGYVLLMTLLLLSVATMMLAGAARASLHSAVRANEAQRELQRHWGAVTCQKAFLLMTEQILVQHEKELNEPVSSARLSMSLGEYEFNLWIADEQAKVNVNTLVELRGRQTAEHQIRNAIRSSRPVTVKLAPLTRPKKTASGDEGRLPVFGSLSQVFPQMRPDQLSGSQQERSVVAATFTCWGDGRLRFQRASRLALTQLCATILGDHEIDGLMQTRRDAPTVKSSEALKQLGIPQEKIQKLSALFVDESHCYSVWVTAREGDHAWHWLAVTQSATGNPIAAVSPDNEAHQDDGGNQDGEGNQGEAGNQQVQQFQSFVW